MRDRILVELRCTGTPSWHIYVPVRIVGTSTVTIAARAIVVGTVLTDKDVRTEQHDLSELPPGYIDDPAVGVGPSRPAARSRAVPSSPINFWWLRKRWFAVKPSLWWPT